MNNPDENVNQDDVVVAYQEVMNKLKLMQKGRENKEESQPVTTYEIETPQEDNSESREQRVVDISSIVNVHEIVRNVTELKSTIAQFLDDIQIKLMTEQEKFDQLKNASQESLNEDHNAIREQLTRKFEYELKMAEISWASEKEILCQKIEAQEQQIERYKQLKEMFS